MPTLSDWTNVQSRMRIVYPWRSSFISRAARNSRRNPRLMKLSWNDNIPVKSYYFFIYLSLPYHTCNAVYRLRYSYFTFYNDEPHQVCLVFTARCTLVQSAVLRSHVVCPSVCLSVCLSVC